jgi:hypothetical protein
MRNNKWLSHKINVILIVILGVIYRYLPIKIQIGIGIPLLIGMIILAFFIKDTLRVKTIMTIVSMVGLLYLLSIGTNRLLIREVFPFVGFIALIGLLLFPRIEGYFKKQEPPKWTIGEIIALVIFTVLFILLVASKIILSIIG